MSLSSGLVATYLSEFSDVQAARVNQEQEWLDDLRQYKGLYPAEVESALSQESPNKSRAFMRLTKVKVNTILSRLMSMLFPANGSRNWDIATTPRPDMPPDMIAMAVQQVRPEKLQGKTPEEIALFVADRAMQNMRTTIADQLVSPVGRPAYREICRQVIFSGLLYGTGVLKGPLVERRPKERWQAVRKTSPGPDGQWVEAWEWELVTTAEESVWPYYESVPIWSFYPDMSADTITDARYVWQEYLFTGAGLNELAATSGFDGTAITQVITQSPEGNATARSYESNLKTLSKDGNGGPDLTGRYRVLERWGYVSGRDLAGMGVDIPEEEQAVEYNANLWFLGDKVIKAVISPLKGGSDWPYHLFSFDADETSIFGEGVASVMRHPQSIINAAVRMILDNSSIASGPLVGLNAQALAPGQKESATDLHPWKVYLFEDAKDMREAITFWQADPRTSEMMNIVKFFSDFADEVTAPRFMSGQGNVKGAGETAHGLSMLMGAANVNLQDLVANFDSQITEPFIKRMYHWNMQFNPRPDIKGDFEVKAMGSSALMAKEVRGPQLLQLAQITDSPRFSGWVKDDALLKEMAENADIRPERFLRTEAEKDAHDALLRFQQAQANLQAVMEAMTKQGIDPNQALMLVMQQNLQAMQTARQQTGQPQPGQPQPGQPQPGQAQPGQGQGSGAWQRQGPVRMPQPNRSPGQMDAQQMQEM